MKGRFIDFLLSMLSVILGIVITFAVQGMIDRAADRREVRSALELVRTELETNREDIATMTGYLAQEREAAQYFLEHGKDLQACPAGTVATLSGLLFADASISVSSDALELLKNSALFPKIGNNLLSMQIIRAYDTGSTISLLLNRHVSARDERFEPTESFLGSEAGQQALRWLISQADPASLADLSDIDAALEALEHYFNGKKR